MFIYSAYSTIVYTTKTPPNNNGKKYTVHSIDVFPSLKVYCFYIEFTHQRHLIQSCKHYQNLTNFVSVTKRSVPVAHDQLHLEWTLRLDMLSRQWHPSRYGHTANQLVVQLGDWHRERNSNTPAKHTTMLWPLGCYLRALNPDLHPPARSRPSVCPASDDTQNRGTVAIITFLTFASAQPRMPDPQNQAWFTRIHWHIRHRNSWPLCSKYLARLKILCALTGR